MFSQLSNWLFSVLILLVFTSTNVYGIACDYYEIQCGTYPYDWCCPDYEYCGSRPGSCFYTTTIIPTTSILPTTTTPLTPSSDFPLSALAVVIIVPICFFLACVTFCIRTQQQPRLRSPVINPNAHTVAYPYQQQPMQGSIRGQIRSVHNVGAAPPLASISSIYEAPPPSYEAATANLPPKYSSAPPPVTVTGEQMNL